MTILTANQLEHGLTVMEPMSSMPLRSTLENYVCQLKIRCLMRSKSNMIYYWNKQVMILYKRISKICTGAGLLSSLVSQSVSSSLCSICLLLRNVLRLWYGFRSFSPLYSSSLSVSGPGSKEMITSQTQSKDVT